MRLLLALANLLFVLMVHAQNWSCSFQPGLVSTFNYFSDGMSNSSFLKVKPNAGLGAAFGIGYRVAPSYTVMVNYAVYPSNLNYAYRVATTSTVLVQGSVGRGFGMREAALLVERQTFLTATRTLHFSWLLRAGLSVNFLPPVNRGDFEEPTVSVFSPAMFRPDSAIMVIHRTHVVGLRLGAGVQMRKHAQARFSYGVLLDGFISPRRFATERIFFSDGNTVVERQISTHGTYISPRVRVCYFFARKKDDPGQTGSQVE